VLYLRAFKKTEKFMNEVRMHPASEENPGFLLWRVSTLWSRSTTVVLKSLGLTHPQFIILAIIDRLTGKEASQEEIERQAVLDPKAVSHLLRSLQVKRLIEPSPIIDEKSKYPLLILTTAGVEMLAKTLPVVESADAAFFASINLKSMDSTMIAALQMLGHANSSK
jgi:DNA-binding MarR family transcriptional regulator